MRDLVRQRKAVLSSMSFQSGCRFHITINFILSGFKRFGSFLGIDQILFHYTALAQLVQLYRRKNIVHWMCCHGVLNVAYRKGSIITEVKIYSICRTSLADISIKWRFFSHQEYSVGMFHEDFLIVSWSNVNCTGLAGTGNVINGGWLPKWRSWGWK